MGTTGANPSNTKHKKINVSLKEYLTKDKAVQLMRRQLERSFPKVCANCKRQFTTLFDYLSNTKQIGPVMSYDVEMGNWMPLEPIGTMICANCNCGNTITLTLKGMPLPQLWLLLAWVRSESQKPNMDAQATLDYLGSEIRKQVFSEYDQEHMRKKIARQ